MDLTKYSGKDGLVVDPSFLYKKNKGNESDLIAEMQSIGLNVSFLNTSGELVRVPVTATQGIRPDKGNEKSGWYVINTFNDYLYATYGNWRS